ncbi:MAG: RNA-binding protein [Pirellulaceae bacterium]|nr:MAG: RNA-binding protein [Pirellulaceae bacterium]
MVPRSMFFRFVINCIPFLAASGVAVSVHGQSTQSGILLTDVTEQTGIDFVHTTGSAGLGYIVEGMSTGIATFDYDGDGDQDLYFLNGAPLKGAPPDPSATNRLYRNDGNWKFTDVTESSGLGDPGYALGVATADYDGDGDVDVYINNFGPNRLYQNQGNGTFRDVTEQAGVANGDKVGAGVGFFDMDGDGDLDLYVANYVDFNYDNHVPIIIGGKYYQAGPQYYRPVTDTLYRNEGNGRFTDVSRESGISQVSGPGMGLVCFDFDNDGDLDIYVCNDGEPNFLFENDGHGHFTEIGMLASVAYDFDGRANSSMGVDIGDYDRDGWFDIIVTNYQGEMPVLYHNLGGGLFEDATSSTRITRELFPHVNWGTSFFDVDNDADLDLYIACGHFDRIEQIDDRTQQKVRNYLLLQHEGQFVDLSAGAGSALAVVESSRGVAFDDLDNDGDIDLVVVNSNAPPTLIRNDSPGGDWLQIELRDPRQPLNQHAIGARVRLPQSRQMQEVLSGRGYQSDYGRVLHFGLGTAASLDVEVVVRWPDGETDTFTLAPNQRWRIVRGATAKPVSAAQ